ncbi:hypothetical protein PoB_001608300 [Plakobranchus ocellatus]|uniref:Uncharacterized protein n=1 Tax=Plakobranchus ocellatus TaxID=259542 RepID=A0AAV3Z4L0_9GAST|nr:hypothetical protein PoB_001608300 [Plakobranchus ocellatus]
MSERAATVTENASKVEEVVGAAVMKSKYFSPEGQYSAKNNLNGVGNEESTGSLGNVKLKEVLVVIDASGYGDICMCVWAGCYRQSTLGSSYLREDTR